MLRWAFTWGLASALALPPLHLIPVLWLAVPALLRLLAAAPGPRRAAVVGFWFGLGHHVAGLYWITEAILIEGARYWWLVPLAVPALAAVLALFLAATCAAARRFPAGWPRVAGLVRRGPGRRRWCSSRLRRAAPPRRWRCEAGRAMGRTGGGSGAVQTSPLFATDQEIGQGGRNFRGPGSGPVQRVR